MNRLTLTVAPDDDGTAELRASVQGAGFAGTGSAWFSVDDLKAFCVSLAAYPIDKNSPPSLEGGYLDRVDAKLTETHLAIRIVPYGGLGRLQVNVHLAEPTATTEPVDPPRSVSTWFIVGYNDLDGFRSAFTKVLGGAIEEATLSSA